MKKLLAGKRRALTGLLLLTWTVAAGVAAWSLLGSTGCHLGGKMNLLIVTMDTTRVDHLRCYGNIRIETPTLNQLAREGVLFENAYSHIPLTLPAHTSIMTGTVPMFHGVIDNGAYLVPDRIETLAEVTKAAGYNTAAFVSAAVLRKVFNLDQGFEHWDEEGIEEQVEDSPLVADRKGDKVTDAALNWLGENYQEPFFLWVHYYDPHAAYDPPEPYKTLYLDHYDGEIAFMDSQIKRLFEDLKEKGIYDKTVIVAIADHGEGLGEHEESTHATFIYNTTQHIPFILRVPHYRHQGRRVKTVVSQIDVMPTVLDYLGIKWPAEVAGESQKELLENESEPEVQRFAFLESKWPLLHYNWSPLSALVSKKYKYIQAPKPELYDLEDDPHEVNNIYEQNQKIAAQYRTRLKDLEGGWNQSKLESTEAEITPEMEKQLAALGYVVGGHEGNVDLAVEKDPKDYKHLIPLFNDSNNARSKSDFNRLLRLSEMILEGDSVNPQALLDRAEALFGLGRYEEAIKAYQQHYTKHDVETHNSYIKIGMCYIRMAGIDLKDGNTQEGRENYLKAEEAFEKSVGIKDRNPIAHYYLGRLNLLLGRPQEALAQFEHPSLKNDELGHVGMGTYYMKAGRPGLAEAEFNRAGDLAGEVSVIYFQEHAQFYMAMGRDQEALEFLEKAIKEDPSLVKEQALMEALERLRKEFPEPEKEALEEGEQEPSSMGGPPPEGTPEQE